MTLVPPARFRRPSGRMPLAPTADPVAASVPPERRTPRCRPAAPLAATLLAALATLGWGAAAAQQPFDVALNGGLLTVRANDAAALDLAAALSAETGINFVVTGDAATTITAEIVDEPFAVAVAKLSPNHLLVRDGKSADSAVTEVVLILDEADAGGGGGGEGFLPSGGPAEEIYDGGEVQVIDDGTGGELMPEGDGGAYPEDTDPSGYLQENGLPPEDDLPPEGEMSPDGMTPQ